MRRLDAGRPDLALLVGVDSYKVPPISVVRERLHKNTRRRRRIDFSCSLPMKKRRTDEEQKRHNGGYRISRKPEEKLRSHLPKDERFAGLYRDLPEIKFAAKPFESLSNKVEVAN